VFNVDTAAAEAVQERANAHLNDLRGHDEPVQCVAFEPGSNKYLVSSSSDASYRIWS
jgi:WD40 repeat protein